MSVPTRPAGPTPPPAQPATYCNPVYDGYLADPYVLAWEDGYLAYGTGPTTDGRVFPILRSADLVHWTPVGGAMEPVATELGADYWAPEVVEADRRFWLYYSVGHGDHRHQLRVAVADTPLGPFTDAGIDLTPHESFAIDPHPFCDDDGSWYLFYARDVLDADRVGTHLAVAELTDMTSLSAPATAVLAPTADWQIFQRDREMYGGVYDWHTLEGPSVRRHGDRYYCTYSGGSYLDESYHVAWVAAPHPLGPWTEPAGAPNQLLATVPGHVRGPGHNSILTTHRGQDLLVYHAWNAGGTQRQMCLDPLTWERNGPTTTGPSWTEQALTPDPLST